MEKTKLAKQFEFTPRKKSRNKQSETINAAGIGNAALGSLAADGIKSTVTPQSHKPATQGDITELPDKLDAKYLFIRNLPPNNLGQLSYYDVENETGVYIPYIPI